MEIGKQIYNDVGDEYGRIEYVDHMGSDQRIIDSARVSFAQDLALDDPNHMAVQPLGDMIHPRWRPEKDPKLLRYLIKNQHWSPLEHCTITWHIVVPLFVRGQWHRHRTWAYNEVSRRYTSDDLEFYIPSFFRPQATKNKQGSMWDPNEVINPLVKGFSRSAALLDNVPASKVLRLWCEDAVRQYEAFLEAGICREQARMVLPQDMYVRYYGTVNLRNALAFINLREDNHAQWEIYKAAEVMRYHLEHLFPETMKAWDEVTKDVG